MKNLMSVDFYGTHLTFTVLEESPTKVTVTHHLVENESIIFRFEKSDLHQITVPLRSEEEHLLSFIKYHIKKLGHSDYLDFISVATCFASSGVLTPRQRKMTSDLLGTIAKAEMKYNLESARDLVNSNVILLDSFNSKWYERFNPIFKQNAPAKGRGQINTIFNMAGFVLSQLQNNKANLGSV